MPAQNNVILVSIQYRLNMFGFLYMNDSTYAPGNQGLLDQQMALQWIQNNIRGFGGDPARVTLFGQSAGAASVSLHLLSPMSWSFFNNGIMQSGTVLSNWALVSQTEAVRRQNAIMSALGCSGSTVQEQIQCAQGFDADTLLSNASATFKSLIPTGLYTDEVAWVPVIYQTFPYILFLFIKYKYANQMR
jgi:carboxylesterase type B